MSSRKRASATNTQLNRSNMPLPGEPRPFRFPDFDRVKLDNGLLVLVAEQNHLPLVSVNLCLTASGLTDPAGSEGLAYFLTETLFEGTASKSSTELANALELLGANYYTHVDWNATQIEINCLRKNLDTSMALYSDVVRNAAYPVREVDRIKNELIIERQRVADNPSKLSIELLFKQIYDGHRYGIPLEGNLESIKRINRDQIVSYHKQIFIPNDAAIIFAGDIRKEEAVNLAKTCFADWSSGEAPGIQAQPVTFPDAPVISLIHKPGAAQAELRMGHPGVERTDPDYYAITLLNEIFGGYFLSRINMNLREKHGYTYGASSVFSYRKIRGPFLVAASVQNEAVEKAIAEVIKELSRMQMEEVSDEELEHAKGYLTGVFPVAFETLDQVAMGLANLVIFRLEEDYYQTFASRIGGVTKNDILKAANKHLHPANISIVVTGDRTKMEDRLKSLGPVKVFDVNGSLLEQGLMR